MPGPRSYRFETLKINGRLCSAFLAIFAAVDLNFHRKLSTAPMLDLTDRHWRNFARLLSRDVLLYTEMVVANAVLRGNPERFLRCDEAEAPVALQLGGADPVALAEASKVAEAAGFCEVNLNCGCPSDKVQSGAFGACLMKEPLRVAKCVEAMAEAVKLPVSVKCRIGVDDFDSWEFFRDFVSTLRDAGCQVFIIHARKAWLKGLSPKENREVPPLDYGRVFELKREFPDLTISLNGGLKTLAQAKEVLGRVDGAMIGRAAYEDPWMLHAADREIYGVETKLPLTRKALLRSYLPYVEAALAEGAPLTVLVPHVLGLFNGLPGARKFRQTLSEGASRTRDFGALLERAMGFVAE